MSVLTKSTDVTLTAESEDRKFLPGLQSNEAALDLAPTTMMTSTKPDSAVMKSKVQSWQILTRRIDPTVTSLRPPGDSNPRVDTDLAFVLCVLYQWSYEAKQKDIGTFQLELSNYPPKFPNPMTSTTMNSQSDSHSRSC